MKESNNIKVSIVTPSYNQSEFITDCINSVKNQSYNNIEHIIVDGGSSDATVEILKKYENAYEMKWISEPDNGMYDAINKGFEISNGDILAWLNTDDIYTPWAIELVVKMMKKLDIDWCTGIPGFWTKEGIYYSLYSVTPIYLRYFIEKGYYHGKSLGWIQQESTFWTRNLWEKAGGKVDSSLKYAGDYYLWKEFASHEKLYTVNSVLSGFRKHDNQKTSNIKEYYKELEDELTFFSKFLFFLNNSIHLSKIISLIKHNDILDVSNVIK